MDMSICITAGERSDKPLTIEVFGLSVSIAGLAPGCPVIVSESGGGFAVSIGGAAGDNGVASQTEACACEEAAAPESAAEALGLTAAAPESAAAIQGLVAAPEQYSEHEQQLFKKLSALRKKISAETRVPPYVVFHDNTLREMCRVLPADLVAMRSIQGVGEAKLDKYGELFIAAIHEYTEAA